MAGVHKVQGGETLGAIAKKYGTTFDEILKLNPQFSRKPADGKVADRAAERVLAKTGKGGRDADFILAGEKIRVESGAPVPDAAHMTKVGHAELIGHTDDPALARNPDLATLRRFADRSGPEGVPDGFVDAPEADAYLADANAVLKKIPGASDGGPDLSKAEIASLVLPGAGAARTGAAQPGAAPVKNPQQPGQTPQVIDMTRLDPKLPVSQSVASEALKHFNPSSAGLPALKADVQSRLDLEKAVLADVTKQMGDFQASEGKKFPLPYPNARTGQRQPPSFANSPAYLAYTKTLEDYRSKLGAAQALVQADTALLDKVAGIIKSGGDLKPVGAFYASEMMPNMAYEVRLYERPLKVDGKTIGVELVDLTNPYDIRHYQGYSADPATALAKAAEDYQFIRPLPQGHIALKASAGTLVRATDAGGVDAKLQAGNQAALAAAQGGQTGGNRKGSPAATAATAYGAKTAFYMGIIPWTAAGAIHVSSASAWNVIFPQAPGGAAGVSPNAYQPPGAWLAGFGALGLTAGLMSFVNDVTSLDNNKVGPGYTVLQASRDLNGMYRSGAITATGLTAIGASGRAPAVASWIAGHPDLFSKLLPTMGAVKSVPLVGSATWFADAVLGTASVFAKYDGKTAPEDIAKRNGQIAGAWTNASIQGMPFVATASAQFLTRNASAIVAQRAAAGASGLAWSALALYTFENGRIQETRANGLGMVSATHDKGFMESVWSPWAYGANTPVDPSYTVGGSVGKAVEEAKSHGAGFWGEMWAGASHLASSGAKWYGKGLVLALWPLPQETYVNFVKRTVGEKYINQDFADAILSYARTDWKDPVFQKMYAEEVDRINAIAETRVK